jgi:hypothetical protein
MVMRPNELESLRGDVAQLLAQNAAQAERIAALEAAVKAAWDATQSVEMAYEDIALAVETTLGAVMDWTDHEDHLPADY